MESSEFIVQAQRSDNRLLEVLPIQMLEVKSDYPQWYSDMNTTAAILELLFFLCFRFLTSAALNNLGGSSDLVRFLLSRTGKEIIPEDWSSMFDVVRVAKKVLVEANICWTIHVKPLQLD